MPRLSPLFVYTEWVMPLLSPLFVYTEWIMPGLSPFARESPGCAWAICALSGHPSVNVHRWLGISRSGPLITTIHFTLIDGGTEDIKIISWSILLVPNLNINCIYSRLLLLQRYHLTTWTSTAAPIRPSAVGWMCMYSVDQCDAWLEGCYWTTGKAKKEVCLGFHGSWG